MIKAVFDPTGYKKVRLLEENLKRLEQQVSKASVSFPSSLFSYYIGGSLHVLTGGSLYQNNLRILMQNRAQIGVDLRAAQGQFTKTVHRRAIATLIGAGLLLIGAKATDLLRSSVNNNPSPPQMDPKPVVPDPRVPSESTNPSFPFPLPTGSIPTPTSISRSMLMMDTGSSNPLPIDPLQYAFRIPEQGVPPSGAPIVMRTTHHDPILPPFDTKAPLDINPSQGAGFLRPSNYIDSLWTLVFGTVDNTSATSGFDAPSGIPVSLGPNDTVLLQQSQVVKQEIFQHTSQHKQDGSFYGQRWYRTEFPIESVNQHFIRTGRPERFFDALWILMTPSLFQNCFDSQGNLISRQPCIDAAELAVLSSAEAIGQLSESPLKSHRAAVFQAIHLWRNSNYFLPNDGLHFEENTAVWNAMHRLDALLREHINHPPSSPTSRDGE